MNFGAFYSGENFARSGILGPKPFRFISCVLMHFGSFYLRQFCKKRGTEPETVLYRGRWRLLGEVYRGAIFIFLFLFFGQRLYYTTEAE